MHVETDQWLMVDNARKAAAAVPGASIATLSDATAHYGVFKAPNVLKDTIKAFVDDSFTASLPGTRRRQPRQRRRPFETRRTGEVDIDDGGDE